MREKVECLSGGRHLRGGKGVKEKDLNAGYSYMPNTRRKVGRLMGGRHLRGGKGLKEKGLKGL